MTIEIHYFRQLEELLEGENPHFLPLSPTPIVIKKLNKMTIVSEIPGFRLSKVKQNLFLP